MAWLFVAATLSLVVAWPFLLGTWIAVQFGVGNASTARFVVGWIFEVLYIAGLVAWLMKWREKRAQWAAEEVQRMAELTASGAVYAAEQGSWVAYRHGTCAVNHRSPETAASCRDSSSNPTWGISESPMPASSLAATPRTTNRAAVGLAAAVLVVGVVVGLAILGGRSTQPPTAEPSLTAEPSPTAEPPPVAAPTPAKPLPADCPALPPNGALVNITLPDLTGTNGADAEQCLRNLGLRNVDLTSVSPEHHYVVLAVDWTVVSTDPAPGSVVSNPDDRVVVNVTKP